MSRSIYFTFFLVLFVAGILNASVKEPQVQIEIKPFKSTIVMYEPFWYSLKLTSLEDTPAYVSYYIRIWAEWNGQKFPIRTHVDEEHRFLWLPGEYQAGESRTIDEYIYANYRMSELCRLRVYGNLKDELPQFPGCETKHAFFRTGVYKIWLALELQGREKFVSNTVEVAVIEPYGKDAEAIARYEPSGVSLAMGRETVIGRRVDRILPKSIDDPFEKVFELRREFLDLYPDSIYAPYVAAAYCRDKTEVHPGLISGQRNVSKDRKEDEMKPVLEFGHDFCTAALVQYKKTAPVPLLRDFLLYTIKAQARLKNAVKVERLMQKFESDYPGVRGQDFHFDRVRRNMKEYGFSRILDGFHWLISNDVRGTPYPWSDPVN